MNIKEALSLMDATDDSQWTGDGMPRIDHLSKVVQNPKLTRKDITDAEPQFTRASLLPSADDQNPMDDGTGQETGQEKEPGNGETLSAPEKAEEAEAVTSQDDVMVEATMPADPVVEVAQPTPPSALASLQASLVIHTESMDKAHAAAEVAKKLAKAESDEVNRLNRLIDMATPYDPQASTRGIRAYINSQNAARAARHGRVRKLLGDSGVSPKELAKTLEMSSPLDKAMHGRKAPRGSARPEFRKA